MKQRERAVTFVTNEIYPLGLPESTALEILFQCVRDKFKLPDTVVLSTGKPLDIAELEQEEIMPELIVGVYMFKEE